MTSSKIESKRIIVTSDRCTLAFWPDDIEFPFVDLTLYRTEYNDEQGDWELPERVFRCDSGEELTGMQKAEVLLVIASKLIRYQMEELLANAHSVIQEALDADLELDMETATLDDVIALGVDLK